MLRKPKSSREMLADLITKYEDLQQNLYKEIQKYTLDRKNQEIIFFRQV